MAREQKHLHEEDRDAIMFIEVKQNEKIPSQIHYVHRFPRDLTADDIYLPVGELHKLQPFLMLMLLLAEL